jgi:hypothetical protein
MSDAALVAIVSGTFITGWIILARWWSTPVASSRLEGEIRTYTQALADVVRVPNDEKARSRYARAYHGLALVCAAPVNHAICDFHVSTLSRLRGLPAAHLDAGVVAVLNALHQHHGAREALARHHPPFSAQQR